MAIGFSIGSSGSSVGFIFSIVSSAILWNKRMSFLAWL